MKEDILPEGKKKKNNNEKAHIRTHVTMCIHKYTSQVNT